MKAVEIFSIYHCYIALDPDEWPGSWEGFLIQFPNLLGYKKKYYEGAKEVISIPIFEESSCDFVDYLGVIYETGAQIPNGGIVFLDESDQIFKTNWEFCECWEWSNLIGRFKKQKCYLHYFSATGAEVEVCRVDKGVRLQHLDHEHPYGIEASRNDLPGILLMNEVRFINEVNNVLNFLQKLQLIAKECNKLEAFKNVFGQGIEN